jgi:hypothetical protein
MKHLVKRYAKDIVTYTVVAVGATYLEKWALRGSAQRRDAWGRAIKVERSLRIEGLFRAANPFTRKKRTSAEVIAAQVLGRRKEVWRPF